MPQLIFYCHEFIGKFIFYALCFLFIFFTAFAWMDVQSDFTHMQDIDGKKTPKNKNLYWFWYLYHRYFKIILYKWNCQFLNMKRKTCFHFRVQEIVYSSAKCNKPFLFLFHRMQMNIRNERAFQLNMFDIQQTWAGTRLDFQVQIVQSFPYGSWLNPRMF